MEQNPQRILGDITNQATKRDRETFEQWYLQKTYQQKFSWEALFAWKEANNFGLTYKRKKNIKYNEGLRANGRVFNTDDKLLNYSEVEFDDGIVELDKILTFARKLDPVESVILTLIFERPILSNQWILRLLINAIKFYKLLIKE